MINQKAIASYAYRLRSCMNCEKRKKMRNDGLDGEHFSEIIDDYVYDNHYDESSDDISKDWQLDLPELTKKIVEEDFKIELHLNIK